VAGEMVHFEMAMKDAGAAKAFWSGLFGWELGSPMPEIDCRLVRRVTRRAGGLWFAPCRGAG
jgi:predicted enzyme related to lactoylglutathione lyase